MPAELTTLPLRSVKFPRMLVAAPPASKT
jgi:hypothetical protein